MKYKCKECGDTFTDITEADHHSYDSHNMEFEDCIIEVQEENLTIDDSGEPSEILDEEGAITEREKQGAIVLEHYNEIEDETTKKQVLSVAMGQSTGKAHDKKFLERRTTANAIKLTYRDLLESLSDPESSVCDLCNIEWSRIQEDMKENLNKYLKGSEDWKKGMMPSPKQITKSVSLPMIRVFHIKAKHPAIWKLIKDLFKIPESQKFKDASAPFTSNPENLSTTEIAERLSADPEARKAFFKEWHLRLQKKRDK